MKSLANSGQTARDGERQATRKSKRQMTAAASAVCCAAEDSDKCRYPNCEVGMKILTLVRWEDPVC